MAGIPSDLCTGLPVFLTLPEDSDSAFDAHDSQNITVPSDQGTRSIEPPLETQQEEEEEQDPIPELIRRSLASLQPLTPFNTISTASTQSSSASTLSRLARMASTATRFTDQINSARSGLQGFLSVLNGRSQTQHPTTFEADLENNASEKRRVVTRKASEDAVAGVDPLPLDDWVTILSATKH